jgi:hypothetical protein
MHHLSVTSISAHPDSSGPGRGTRACRSRAASIAVVKVEADSGEGQDDGGVTGVPNPVVRPAGDAHQKDGVPGKEAHSKSVDLRGHVHRDPPPGAC